MKLVDKNILPFKGVIYDTNMFQLALVYEGGTGSNIRDYRNRHKNSSPLELVSKPLLLFYS